jgi:hypothetical protein
MCCASEWTQGIACMCVHNGHWHIEHSVSVWFHIVGSSAVSLFEYLSVSLVSIHHIYSI